MKHSVDYGIVEDAKPVMISGVYRSGTTFLSALLGAHSKLKAASSTIKFLRFCLGKYGDVREKDNYCQLVADTQKRVKVRWGLELDARRVITKLETKKEQITYARIYDILMRDLLHIEHDYDIRWVEKLAVQWADIPYFLDMFPNGKVIHIFRDPRDVVASYKNMTFEPGNTFLDAAFNFRSAVETLTELKEKYSERVMVVKAEEIAKKPVGYAKEICEFLELDYEDSMVDARQLHTEGEDWASNTSYGIKYKGLPDGKSRWKEYLTHSEVIFTEMISQPYLTELGYESSELFPTEEEWMQIYSYINEDFLNGRFKKWLREGKGSQGYRTDPYMHEMKIVFPERFLDKEKI